MEFKITNAGLNAAADGREIKVDRIALGSGKGGFEASMESLHEQKESYPIESFKKIATGRAHLTSKIDSEAGYKVNEIGILLNDGTLFAYYSNSDGVTEKFPDQHMLMAFDLLFGEMKVTVNGPGERLSLDLAEDLAIVATNIIKTQTAVLEQNMKLARILENTL